MKNQYLGLYLALGLIFCQPLTAKQKTYQNKQHAITYAPHKGRFGDHICGYSKTKWLSYKYKIPFLFNPVVPGHPEALSLFKQLTMFNAETHASKELVEFIGKRKYETTVNPYLKTVVIQTEHDLSVALNGENIPTLFICTFKIDLDLTYEKNFKKYIEKYICNVDLQTYLISLEKPFMSELKKMLKPITSIIQKLPEDRITVAVHLRRGGGYDKTPVFKEYFDSHNYYVKYNNIQVNDKRNKITVLSNITSKPNPSERINISKIRFLPKQYYVDQIVKLSNLLNNIPLFVYIFTDDKDIISLVNEIKNKVNLPNITWGCRTEENAYNLNIVEDFEAISQFDCLIRPHSNFSLGASLLGNHKIIIAPSNAKLINGEILLVDEVNIIINNLHMNIV
ncbi:MAG: hypothetical protein V1646_05020 [bacterium]